MTLKELTDKVSISEYLVGDATANKILKPIEWPMEILMYSNVVAISAKTDTPVIWVELVL